MSAKRTEDGRGGVLAIGLMSGTSHDGASAAIVGIAERKRPPARAIRFRTYPYPPGFRARLLAATGGERIAAASFGTGGVSRCRLDG